MLLFQPFQFSLEILRLEVALLFVLTQESTRKRPETGCTLPEIGKSVKKSSGVSLAGGATGGAVLEIRDCLTQERAPSFFGTEKSSVTPVLPCRHVRSRTLLLGLLSSIFSHTCKSCSTSEIILGEFSLWNFPMAL